MTDQMHSPVGYPPTSSGRASTGEPSTTEKAAESAQAGKQAAGQVATTAAEQAKDVAREAQTQARNVVGEARNRVRDRAGEQQRNAAANLHSLAGEMESMAQNSEQRGIASDLAQRAAGRAHRTASWLESRGPEQVLDEVRSFARRRPGTFLLGALAAGVLAGRVTRGMVQAHSDSDDGSAAESEWTSGQPIPAVPPTATEATSRMSSPRHAESAPTEVMPAQPGQPMPGQPMPGTGYGTSADVRP